MKQLIAFVLAFTMVAAMAVPALAEGDTTDTTNNTTNVTKEGQETSIPVHGTYQGPKDVISVDVVWDAMDFIYTNKSDGTWDPTSHTYKNSTEEGWSWKKPDGTSDTKIAPEIKLTNHSNAGVKAAFGFNSAIEGLTSSFTNTDGSALTGNAFTLPTAVNTALADAPSKATAFSLNGTGITDNDVNLGNITVTISKDDTAQDTPEETVEEVSSQDTLLQAIGKGKSVKLVGNIDVQWDKPAMGVDAYPGTIDLDNHTLSISDDTQMHIADGSNATIKNGTVKGSSSSFFVVIKDDNTNVTMNGCTIENSGTSSAVYVENSTVLLNDCTLTCTSGSYALEVENGNVTLSGETKLTANTTTSPVNVKGGKLTCLTGTYNFDPSTYVDPNSYTVDTTYMPDPSTEETAYTVWIVTAKADSQT